MELGGDWGRKCDREEDRILSPFLSAIYLSGYTQTGTSKNHWNKPEYTHSGGEGLQRWSRQQMFHYPEEISRTAMPLDWVVDS